MPVPTMQMAVSTSRQKPHSSNNRTNWGVLRDRIAVWRGCGCESFCRRIRLTAQEIRSFMLQNLHILTPGLLGRFAAILSLAVFLLGKTVHLHQECGPDCGADCRTDAICCSCHCEQHHSKSDSEDTSAREDGSTREPDSDPLLPSHDCRQCVVCCLLAQVPDCVEFVTFEASAVLCHLETRVSECTSKQSAQCSCSRGPPAVAAAVPHDANGFVWV